MIKWLTIAALLLAPVTLADPWYCEYFPNASGCTSDDDPPADACTDITVQPPALPWPDGWTPRNILTTPISEDFPPRRITLEVFDTADGWQQLQQGFCNDELYRCRPFDLNTIESLIGPQERGTDRRFRTKVWSRIPLDAIPDLPDEAELRFWRDNPDLLFVLTATSNEVKEACW